MGARGAGETGIGRSPEKAFAAGASPDRGELGAGGLPAWVAPA